MISFIDFYEKTRRNFPEVKVVKAEECLLLGKTFVEIGRQYGITIRPCGEGSELARFGADCSGCMTIATYEQALPDDQVHEAKQESWIDPQIKMNLEVPQ